jgi:predicted kinase
MSSRSLVVVCGPPGVGKSTVAELIADRTGAARLRTDVVRRDVAPDPDYTDDERRRVYGELFERAGGALADDRWLVLDGTFQYRETRDRAADLAAGFGADFELVRVTCDEQTVRQRLAERTEDPSDAVFENYRAIRRAFDPVRRDHLTVDNSGSLDRTKAAVRDLFA